VAALRSWQRSAQDAGLRIGESVLCGPIEHDRDLGICRIQVRLARGRLCPLLTMRLEIHRWSISSTAVELIPCRRVRPTTAYFRAGHFLLDSLARRAAAFPGLATSGTKLAHRTGIVPSGRGKEHEMSLFIDVHTMDGPVGLDEVAKAHQADLGTQAKYGANYLAYWVDEEHGKIFCLVEAPGADAAAAVHRDAHGLTADQIYPVTEGI